MKTIGIVGVVGTVVLASAASPFGVGCGSSTPGDMSPPAALTYYRDVEPIVQVHCNGCHAPGGIGGVSFDKDSIGHLAPLMASKVTAGVMPPWPPGPLSKPMAGARVLSSAQIDTIARWAAAGAPLGNLADHQDRAPRVTFNPGRTPDLQVMMPDPGYVAPPAGSKLTDEVRCFVMDLGNTSNVWVTALNWVTGQPGAIHHVGGLAVDAKSAAVALGFYNKDGRPGYECAGSFGAGVNGVAGFSASGAGRDTGTQMPAGAGIFVPAGSSIIISMHYVIANLKGNDKSGVQLWYAADTEKATLRPMLQYQFGAPSELPCPTGVTMDPNDRCSRAYGINQVKSETPEKTLATNDYLLRKCGTTLEQYYAQLKFNPTDPSHFAIPTACDDTFPWDGLIQVVHAHMHTRGASSRIELQNADGSYDPILDIPNYQWTWEGAYLLQTGLSIKAGQKLRLHCTYDNGTANQWSAATGQPGHDGPASPPLEAPHYVVAGPERGDDMCAAFLTVERSPYKGMTWADTCHEAQAIYDDNCTDAGVNLVSGPCAGQVERYAVLLIETPQARIKPLWCGPKSPAAAMGPACSAVMNCALGCGAVKGFASGLTADCESACKGNVNAWGKTMGQPAQPASQMGAWRFDFAAACANAACGDKKTWQEYLACAGAACADLIQLCYGK